jgi:hypothetical protein
VNGRPKIRFVLITLVGIALWMQDGAALHAQRVSLEAHVQELTGTRAFDCGTHTRAAASAEGLRQSLVCARDAARKRASFWVVQRGAGEDSEIALGLLGKGDGSVFWFDYDSAPCGGPGCAERFITRPCALSNVVVIQDAGSVNRLSCTR